MSSVDGYRAFVRFGFRRGSVVFSSYESSLNCSEVPQLGEEYDIR